MNFEEFYQDETEGDTPKHIYSSFHKCIIADMRGLCHPARLSGSLSLSGLNASPGSASFIFTLFLSSLTSLLFYLLFLLFAPPHLSLILPCPIPSFSVIFHLNSILNSILILIFVSCPHLHSSRCTSSQFPRLPHLFPCCLSPLLSHFNFLLSLTLLSLLSSLFIVSSPL